MAQNSGGLDLARRLTRDFISFRRRLRYRGAMKNPFPELVAGELHVLVGDVIAAVELDRVDRTVAHRFVAHLGFL